VNVSLQKNVQSFLRSWGKYIFGESMKMDENLFIFPPIHQKSFGGLEFLN